MGEREDAGTRAARRGAAAEQRGHDIHQRGVELAADEPIRPQVPGLAAAAAATAEGRAADAADSATVQQRKSARAHDEAAKLYERAAANGAGDVDAHRDAANRHTAAAVADRDLADERNPPDPL